MDLKNVSTIGKARMNVSDSIILSDGKSINITIQVMSNHANIGKLKAKEIADNIINLLK